ncbi:MAG: hypothetical protein JW833_00550 [Prolixibacteraceae bacterium]|nr:hypothetical protein [Prolixibacteraceae bacterium]
MQPSAQKTAALFHAKDDIPEVRQEVYRVIKSHKINVIAAIKDKQKVVQYALSRKAREADYRYRPSELYDFLTRRIFTNNLHSANRCEICFSIRGDKPRTDALRKSIEIARERFIEKYEKDSKSSIIIHS